MSYYGNEVMAVVQVSHDGMQVEASAVGGNTRIEYHFLSGKVKRIGPIYFHYGMGGAIRSIGYATVSYGVFGNITHVGHDSRVQIMVSGRPPIRYDNDRR